jgi:hypothetical protein
MCKLFGIVFANLSVASFCAYGADGPLSHQANQLNGKMVVMLNAAYERSPTPQRLNLFDTGSKFADGLPTEGLIVWLRSKSRGAAT